MTIELKADAHAAGKPLAHYWSRCVGAGRANEGLRAGWLEQMKMAVEQCGFQYIRFHGLFHDDMFVYREVDGKPVYNFQYIDELFDRLLDMGIRPFIEFGFCPSDLATEKGTVFWWKGNGSPPNDYVKWGELIRRVVTHWVERYGMEEVRQWYFEVWNEPNLNPFFRGTRSQYFELYKTTVLAVKGVEGSLRVGGPSTSNFVPDARFDGETEDSSCLQDVLNASELDALDWRPVWLEAFLNYCQKENLPVDFVSCHPYPTDWALDEHTPGGFRKNTRGVGATPRDLLLLRKMIDGSAFPDAEIHLTEWNSSSSPRDFTHDFLQAATYIVKVNIEGAGLVDSMSYWTFTDVFEEGGAGDGPFHGGFGMINYQGVQKPAFHAYRFLNNLGDEVLERFPSGIVTRNSKTKKLSALAWHYPSQMPLSVPASFDSRDKAYETLALGDQELLVLDWKGLKPFGSLMVETLDVLNGNAMGVWEQMGKPEEISREQAAFLREDSTRTRKEYFEADAQGVFSLKRMLIPWSVVLIKEME